MTNNFNDMEWIVKNRIFFSGAKNPVGWSIWGAIILFAGMQYLGCGGNATTSTVRQEAPREAPKGGPAIQNPRQETGQMTGEERQREVLLQYNLGWPYYRAREYELAIPHFWNVIKYDSENKYPGIYLHLAEAYVELQKPDSALLVYEMGALKDPTNILVHQRLQWLYRTRGELDKAISETEEILRLDDGNDEYLRQLVDLLVRTGQLGKAVAVYDNLLAKNPGNVQYSQEKMNLLHQMGDSGK